MRTAIGELVFRHRGDEESICSGLNGQKFSLAASDMMALKRQACHLQLRGTKGKERSTTAAEDGIECYPIESWGEENARHWQSQWHTKKYRMIRPLTDF
jgi:hypothetical protein